MQGDLGDVAAVFDLDGTLIDTADDLAAAMNHALVLAGRPAVSSALVRHLVGHGAKAMLRQGFALSGPEPDAAALEGHVEAFLAYYLEHIADLSRPFPHVVRILDDLRAAGARIAICTNKREAPSRALIAALGLSDRFDAIVGMDTASAPKPDPAPVRLCLDLTGAARAVFIGDSDTDIRAAAAAGLPCLLATFGYGPTTLAADAFAAFADYREAPALIRKALGVA